MALLLGIDFGTSCSKVGRFEPAGARRGLGQAGSRRGAGAAVLAPVARGLAEALTQAGADAVLGRGLMALLAMVVHSDRVVPPQAHAVAVHVRARTTAS